MSKKLFERTVVEGPVDKWYDSIEIGKCYRISNYGTKQSDDTYKKTSHEIWWITPTEASH